VLVELDGSYTGMGDDPQPDFRMYGLILSLPVGTIFVKMVGPRELLAAERERFLAFCDSLRLEAPREDASDESAETPASRWSWQAPPSWIEDPARGTREVSFRLGANGETECYVTVLAGTGGGLLNNLNRWRSQLGLGPIEAGALEDLERVELLGRETPLLEAYGSYTGMDDEKIERAGLLGVACELAGSSLFVKMIGPEEDVRGATSDFIAFCASLEGM
jgi:hypothetical protein